MFDLDRCPDTNKPLGLMLLNGLTKLINEYKEVSKTTVLCMQLILKGLFIALHEVWQPWLPSFVAYLCVCSFGTHLFVCVVLVHICVCAVLVHIFVCAVLVHICV